MQVTVITELHVAPHQADHALAIATELRANAIRQPGFITGETLIDIEDHQKVVMFANWGSLEDWKLFETSAERQQLEGNVDSLLSEPMKMRIFTNVASSPAASS